MAVSFHVHDGHTYAISSVKTALSRFAGTPTPTLLHLLLLSADEVLSLESVTTAWKIEVSPTSVGYLYLSDLEVSKLDKPLIMRRDLMKHQSRESERMTRGGAATSSIVILPCGAGKTLLAIATLALIGRTAFVICVNKLGISQWLDEFKRHTNCPPETVQVLNKTGPVQEFNGKITLTMYTEITEHAAISETRQAALGRFMGTKFGACVLDECHHVPAEGFRTALGKFDVRFKLGITATLVRQDDAIRVVEDFIGDHDSIRRSANIWTELMTAGVIGKPEVIDIHCTADTRLQKTVDLVEEYCKKSKVIVFFTDLDDMPVLERALSRFNALSMSGSTSELARKFIIGLFKNCPTANVLIASSIADEGVDVPNARIGIQYGFRGGQQRQETQRIGRLMRRLHGDDMRQAKFFTLYTDATAADLSERRGYLEQLGLNLETQDEAARR